jgi:hypothetical protein
MSLYPVKLRNMYFYWRYLEPLHLSKTQISDRNPSGLTSLIGAIKSLPLHVLYKGITLYVSLLRWLRLLLKLRLIATYLNRINYLVQISMTITSPCIIVY